MSHLYDFPFYVGQKDHLKNVPHEGEKKMTEFIFGWTIPLMPFQFTLSSKYA